MKDDVKFHLATMGAMLMYGGGNHYTEPFETEKEKEERLQNAEITIKKANGLKQYFYGENSVWAINQKNADKKARKNSWI